MSVQKAHLGGAVIVCGFGTLIVVALAWAAYTSAQRCLVSGRCQHCTVGKRSLALALPSQLFAAFAMLLALGYEAQRAGLLGADAAASPAACRAIFVASHLTPSLYAAPYVLRGLRMATLFDTNLRRKYRWLVQDRMLWAILGSLNVLSIIIGGTILAITPSRLQATECYFYEDRLVFIALLVVYAAGVMAMLRLFIANEVKDQFNITRELLTCFGAWVVLAGSHFLYAFLASQVPSVAAVEQQVPSHTLLLLMFSFTSLQSWYRPAILDPSTLPRSARLRMLRAQFQRLALGLQVLRHACASHETWATMLQGKVGRGIVGEEWLPGHSWTVRLTPFLTTTTTSGSDSLGRPVSVHMGDSDTSLADPKRRGSTTLGSAIGIAASGALAHGDSPMQESPARSPGTASPSPRTSPGPSSSDIWCKLVGVEKGGRIAEPYRALLPLVPGTLCTPRDPLAFWCWHALGCSACRPCCGGASAGPDPVPATWWAHDNAVDGLRCCTCQPSRSPGGVYAVHSTAARNMVDDADDADGGSGDSWVGEGGCCRRAPCVCLGRGVLDQHGWAASTLVWGGVLGVSRGAVWAACPAFCGDRAQQQAEADQEDDADEVQAFVSTQASQGAKYSVGIGRDGSVTLASSTQVLPHKRFLQAIVRQFVRDVTPSQRVLLLASMHGVAVASSVGALLGSESDGSSSDDRHAGSGSAGGSLRRGKAGQAGLHSQYSGPIMRALAWVMCIPPKRNGTGGTPGSSSGGTDGAGGEGGDVFDDEQGLHAVHVAVCDLNAEQQQRVANARMHLLQAVWSLPKLLMHPAACAILKQHSKACLCPELVDFIVAVREFKRCLAHVAQAVSQAVTGTAPAREQTKTSTSDASVVSRESGNDFEASLALTVWMGLLSADEAVSKVLTTPGANSSVELSSIVARRKAATAGRAAERWVFGASWNMFRVRYSPLVSSSLARAMRRSRLAGTGAGQASRELLTSSGRGGSGLYAQHFTDAEDSFLGSVGSLRSRASGSIVPHGAKPSKRRTSTHTTSSAQTSGTGEAPSTGLKPVRAGARRVRAVSHSTGSSSHGPDRTASDGHTASGTYGVPPRRAGAMGSVTVSLGSPVAPLPQIGQGGGVSASAAAASVPRHVSGSAAPPPSPGRQDSTLPPSGREADGSMVLGGTNVVSGALQDDIYAHSVSELHTSVGQQLPFKDLGVPDSPLPRVSAPAVQELVHDLVDAFLTPGAPLEVNISASMRCAVLDEIAAVCGEGAGVTPPPMPRAQRAAQRRRAACTAPVPSTLADADAAWDTWQADSAQGVAVRKFLQVQLDTLVRLSCLFDGVLVEVLKLVEENVVSSLFSSDLGRRLALLRFRPRLARSRSRSMSDGGGGVLDSTGSGGVVSPV